ncbi:TspO/MBR family protein [Actinocorallia populi]|uniref:TspO/MBR family protein n=1 Tax=Actinocorallia populi TaxID=2079200 RepID=UPI000D08E929|nr:TspO/MBR family protein [Actinocorallia populi]
MTTTKANTLLKTSMAVGVAAGAGGLVTDAKSDWYRELDKPSWQPPPQAFGIVWPALYGLIAYSAGRAMDRAPAGERRGVAQMLGVNLALNTGWSALFFAAKKPRVALGEIVALNVSNALLVSKAWRADRTAGMLLLPYAAWTAFATVLNSAIVRRN